MIFPGMSGRWVRGFPKGAMFFRSGDPNMVRWNLVVLDWTSMTQLLPSLFFLGCRTSQLLLVMLGEVTSPIFCWAYLGSCCIQVLNRSHHWQGLHALPALLLVIMSYSIPVANVPQVWLLPSSCPIPVVGGCHPTISLSQCRGLTTTSPFSNIFANIHVPKVSPQFSHVFQFSNICSNFPYSFTRFQPINLGKWGPAAAPGLQHRACWGAAAEGHSLRRVPAKATGAWRGDGIMVGIILDILVGHGYCMVLLLCYRLL